MTFGIFVTFARKAWKPVKWLLCVFLWFWMGVVVALWFLGWLVRALVLLLLARLAERKSA